MENYKNLQQYIEQRLDDLDKEKDAMHMIWKGKLSFGLDEKEFGHLKAWKNLIKRKKSLVKWLWFDAFFLSLFIIGITTDIIEKFAENWLKALFGLILLSLLVMLFFVISAYFNLFVKFRDTEREVRKLIYQDMLVRLQEENAKS